MKKVVLATVLLLGLGLESKAQEKPQVTKAEAKHERIELSPQERAAKDAERAEKELGLNAEQKMKWQAASLERINANALLKEKMNGSTTPEEREQLRKQMRINNDKFNGTVNGFLTDEQKAKHDEMKKAKRPHYQGKDRMEHKEYKGRPQPHQNNAK